MAIQIIHIVLGKANPDRMNGVNKVVNSLATHQSSLGYDVSVWGITKSLEINYPTRNYKTVLFYDRGKFQIDPKWNVELQKIDTDTVFHIHGGFIPQFYKVARKLKSFGFEYILTPHGAYNTVALKRSATKKKVFITLFEKWLVKNAKTIHFIGDSEVKSAFNVFGKIPFCLIPNGQEISTTVIDENSQKKNSIPIFGFIGRIDIHTKGLDLLLKGFAKYISNDSNSGELWIIGDGPEKASLAKMAQNLGISSSIKFLGALYGSEKTQYIQQMDYLCLTSRNEGLPGVVLEAASMGVPCIVSPETNMVKYVNKHKAGLCLTENTAEEISNKLSLSTQTNCASSDLLNMLRKEFDWSNISEQLIQEYAA